MPVGRNLTVRILGLSPSNSPRGRRVTGADAWRPKRIASLLRSRCREVQNGRREEVLAGDGEDPGVRAGLPQGSGGGGHAVHAVFERHSGSGLYEPTPARPEDEG